MSLKGLIFDFDGLILDTEMPKYQAWMEIYQEHNQALDLAEYAKCIGSSNLHFDPLTALVQISGDKIDISAVRQKHQKRELELVNKEMVLPGISDLLREAREKHLALAIASSSDRPWVINHLTRLNLIDYFDIVVTENEVNRVKPFPDLFQTALRELGLKPGEAVVFEDSPNGFIAAKDAGLFVFGVPNPITVQLDLSRADHILPSLKGIDLEHLLFIFEEYRKTQ